MKKRNCLKQVSPQEERKLCLKLIVSPYPKIRYAKHTHTGVRVSLREVAVMRDTRGRGALEHFTDETCPPDRRRSTSRERKEKKKDRRKDSRNRRTYLPAKDETVTSVVHGN